MKLDKLELMFDSRNTVGMVMDGWVLRPGSFVSICPDVDVPLLFCAILDEDHVTIWLFNIAMENHHF